VGVGADLELGTEIGDTFERKTGFRFEPITAKTTVVFGVYPPEMV
jgi:hypothetical protein